jgi:hypothetical protein
MPIKHLTFFALTVFVLVSCKKNSGTNAAENANKLKTYIENDTVGGTIQSDTFAVSYDNDNRLTGLVSPNLKEIYAYQSKSYTLDLYVNGVLNVHEMFFINGSSLVDSTIQYNNTNDTTTEGYVYNGTTLTALLTYDYINNIASIDSRDDYTYDNNGNLLKDVQSDGYGNVSLVYAYTYTTDPITARIKPTYYPLQAKYLPATLTLTDGFGNPQGTITYTYVLDSSSRLTKETDAADNGDVSTKTYIYE